MNCGIFHVTYTLAKKIDMRKQEIMEREGD